jgi:hypothetical protein
MDTAIFLPLDESQVITLAHQLTPAGKRALLRTLLLDLDELDRLVEYGNQRIRQLATQRGLDWETLSEDECMRLVDDLKHDDVRG